MKALVYENYTQNDDFESILQIKDIPEPTPKPNVKKMEQSLPQRLELEMQNQKLQNLQIRLVIKQTWSYQALEEKAQLPRNLWGVSQIMSYTKVRFQFLL